MNITEELKSLLENVELSEDALIKMKLMVENAIQERTAELRKQLEEAKAEAEKKIEYIKQKSDEYAEYVVKEMAEKIDSYSQFIVEKFIEENKKALIESQEYSRMKNIFEKVKETFEEGLFQINEDQYIKELKNELEERIQAYNEIFEEATLLKKKLDEKKYEEIFNSLTRDLAETQREKISRLIENVNFKDVDEYKRAIEIMIEELSSETKNLVSVNEGKDDKSARKVLDERIQKYLKYL